MGQRRHRNLPAGGIDDGIDVFDPADGGSAVGIFHKMQRGIGTVLHAQQQNFAARLDQFVIGGSRTDRNPAMFVSGQQFGGDGTDSGGAVGRIERTDHAGLLAECFGDDAAAGSRMAHVENQAVQAQEKFRSRRKRRHQQRSLRPQQLPERQHHIRRRSAPWPQRLE
ncbi:hypothetical protein SDC9_93257 [bioreactor metagenome]|uniref:Uncharacterized protein n=1 Tax=bioreactor metagenome TaxID=1076179 RepID=A0A645A6R1_9ZZZZ